MQNPPRVLAKGGRQDARQLRWRRSVAARRWAWRHILWEAVGLPLTRFDQSRLRTAAARGTSTSRQPLCRFWDLGRMTSRTRSPSPTFSSQRQHSSTSRPGRCSRSTSREAADTPARPRLETLSRAERRVAREVAVRGDDGTLPLTVSHHTDDPAGIRAATSCHRLDCPPCSSVHLEPVAGLDLTSGHNSVMNTVVRVAECNEGVHE
jgi:hypothetical protein